MVRAELMGGHTHATQGGVEVHVWRRGDRFLARGRWQGRAFGETLGRDPQAAASRLRKLLTEIEEGAYVRPSDQPKQPIFSRRNVRLSVRQLANEFLKAKRAERGLQTAGNYRARLRPVLDFADRPEQLGRWPQAASVDAEFVAALRAFLMTYQISRNGRQSAARRVMSSTHARHVLETLRGVFNWALDPVTARLPRTMLNPFRRGSVPEKPPKNLLRDDRVPLDLRVRLVERMDE